MDTNYQDSQIFENRPLNYASFWQRFGAAFIDGIIVSVAAGIIGSILGLESNVFAPRRSLNYGYNYTGNLPSLVIGWLYEALMNSGPKQATLGKMALNIKVVNLDGNRISFGQATGRHFGKIISALILLIGYLMMLWDDKKQTLHDKMAGTLVVENDGVRA